MGGRMYRPGAGLKFAAPGIQDRRLEGTLVTNMALRTVTDIILTTCVAVRTMIHPVAMIRIGTTIILLVTLILGSDAEAEALKR